MKEIKLLLGEMVRKRRFRESSLLSKSWTPKALDRSSCFDKNCNTKDNKLLHQSFASLNRDNHEFLRGPKTPKWRIIDSKSINFKEDLVLITMMDVNFG